MIRPPNQDRARIVRVGGREFLTKGLNTSFWSDIFHISMEASWPKFFLGFATYFLVLNSFFAFLYWLAGDCIANARPDSLADKFFFSVETLATVGYGDMHPGNFTGHLIVTAEIFLGMSTLAVVTGLIFARFSRPRARIIFAKVLTLARHNGHPTLMARFANARHSLVNEAEASIWLLYSEVTAEGMRFRRFKRLELLHSHNPIFAFSWTLLHRIDESSPLFGLGPEGLEEMDAFFMVIFRGLDDVSGQNLNMRNGYERSDLRFGEVYVDILTAPDNGPPQIDYRLIHDTEPQALDETAT
jgi:inward rectifier potassium channel